MKRVGATVKAEIRNLPESEGAVMYEFRSKVRYTEVGRDLKLRLDAMLDYFQDTCTFQSEELGIGIDYLAPKGWAWVLSAWQIVVKRYPRLGEEITVGTAPYEFRGFMGFRNFRLSTPDGEELACANSVWALIDLENTHPMRPTEEMMEKYCLEPPIEMDYASRKIGAIQGGSEKERIPVSVHQLDTNEHVNNVQYVRMAMDYFPETSNVVQMRAEYKKSAKLGDVIFPRVVQAENKTVVSLNDEAGAVYALIEFEEG